VHSNTRVNPFTRSEDESVSEVVRVHVLLNVRGGLGRYIPHYIRIMISMKNGTCNFSFISLKICMGGWVFATATPIEASKLWKNCIVGRDVRYF